MNEQEKVIKRQEQLKEWIKDNALGFMLWSTFFEYSNGSEMVPMTLQQWQCKDGIYIVQIDERDNSFLIFKVGPDFSQK